MPGPRGSNARSAVARETCGTFDPIVGNDSRTGMTGPAWGTSAADRLVVWSERSMHSGRAMQRRGAGALRLKASSGRQSLHSDR